MPCCKCKEFKWENSQEVIATDDEGNEYCLFHAPAELKKGRHEEFMDAVWERINCVIEFNKGVPEENQIGCNLSGTIFAEDAHFNGMHFPRINFSGASFYGEVNFMNTIFNGNVNFMNTIFNGNINFMNTIFNGHIKFNNVKFSRFSNFINAKFNEGVSFFNTAFDGTVSFDTATFKESATFCNVTFNAGSSFKYADFSSDVFFLKIIFNNGAHFFKAHFNKEAEFKDIIFGNRENKTIINLSETTLDDSGSLSFVQCTINSFFIADNTSFYGCVSFYYAYFNEGASFSKSMLGNVSFHYCRFEKSPIFDRTDLRKAELLGAPVEDFCFMACQWPESHGRTVTYDTYTLENKNIKHLEDLYRRLKKAAQAEKDETLASDFHYAEKEMMRLHAFSRCFTRGDENQNEVKKENISSRLQSFGKGCVLSLYKFISGYGEQPMRAFWVLLLLIAMPYIFLAWNPLIVFIWTLCSLLLFSGFNLIFLCILLFATCYLDLHTSNTSLLFQQFVDVTNNDTIRTHFLYFLPLIKIPIEESNNLPNVLLMLLFQIGITLQAALFGFALRNRFRR